MKKLQTFIHNNIFYFIILLVGGAYILSGASEIIKTGKTIDAIVAASALTTILGWLISALFGQAAIKAGYDDPDFIAAQNSQAEAVEAIDGNIEKIDTYCDKENEAVMVRKRTRILKKAGIKYSMFESGNYSGIEMTKRRKAAIRKAESIGYGYLTSEWLLADIDEAEDENEKKTSVKKYISKQNISNIITKIITGTIGGLYVIEPFSKAEWNIIIWRLFFFAIMVIFGYVRYITDFNFIVRDYRKTIVSKTNYLVKFKNSLLTHPDWYVVKEPELVKVEAPAKKEAELKPMPQPWVGGTVMLKNQNTDDCPLLASNLQTKTLE